MYTKRDLYLLAFFRENARKSLTKISKETNIPVSTIFDRLKNYEKSLIKKHTCLIDFKKLGFEIRVGMLIKSNKEKRPELEGFLINHQRINNLFRITGMYDYFLEALFRDMRELQEFNEKLEDYGIERKKDLFIIEEVKREAFIDKPEMVDLLIN